MSEYKSVTGVQKNTLIPGAWSKCPIFVGNFTLKPATIALKIGHLAFQVMKKMLWPNFIPNLEVTKPSPLSSGHFLTHHPKKVTIADSPGRSK